MICPSRRLRKTPGNSITLRCFPILSAEEEEGRRFIAEIIHYRERLSAKYGLGLGTLGTVTWSSRASGGYWTESRLYTLCSLHPSLQERTSTPPPPPSQAARRCPSWGEWKAVEGGRESLTSNHWWLVGSPPDCTAVLSQPAVLSNLSVCRRARDHQEMTGRPTSSCSFSSSSSS